ncbi:Peroxiredoxin-6 [Heterocephalus glaber]|uniref:Peroxiredoxin-6 n=1 Tax=Heterocephalus glaber TaxID=10181 RepID=G5B7S6_HETGA|nr:Peroxiredoxin-6 [Heterocephalus glaber]
MPGKLLLLLDKAPNFEANTTIGSICFHDVLGDSQGILFYPPSVEDHLAWNKDINAYNGDEPTEKLPFPITDDKNQELAILLGMLDPAEKDENGMPVTARVVFVFGPDKKLKLSILYPDTTDRNFDEILRVVISLQLTAEKKVATLVN